MPSCEHDLEQESNRCKKRRVILSIFMTTAARVLIAVVGSRAHPCVSRSTVTPAELAGILDVNKLEWFIGRCPLGIFKLLPGVNGASTTAALHCR